MSLFSKPKPQATRAEALADLRETLRDAVAAASDLRVHPTEISRALKGALQDFEVHLALFTPVASAAC